MAKGQSTAMRWAMILVGVGLGVLMLISLLSPQEYRVPGDMKKRPIRGIYATMLSTIGIPDDWLYTPAIIYLFFVPLIGITAIVYGFLDSMQIFPNINVNLLLALVFAFATIPFGVFTTFVSTLFALMGAYSTGAFAFLFFFGVIFVVMERMGFWFRLPERKALQMSANYDALRDWLLDVHTNTANRTNTYINNNILPRIAKVLEEAEKARRKGREQQAVIMLKNAVNRYYPEIQRHGGYVPRKPKT